MDDETTTSDADSEMEAMLAEARGDLLFYTQSCNPDYIASKFHVFLADKLQKVAEGKIKRLIVTCPPRHGKTAMIAIEFPTWLLGKRPDTKIVLASYGLDLSMTSSKAARARMASEEYQEIFRTRIEEGDGAAHAWRSTGGGGYKAAGIGSALTGFGADVLLIDDAVRDFADAHSPTVLENTWDWYHCFHPDTEILTMRGWLRIGDVRVGDLAASLNPKTRAFTYEPVNATQSFPFKGELLEADCLKGIACAVTPNHTFWVTGTKDLRGELKPCMAKNLPADCGVPQWAIWTGKTPSGMKVFTATGVHPMNPSKPHPRSRTMAFEWADWCEFLGWYIAEGSFVAKRGYVRISQKKTAGRVRIEALLRKMGVRFWKDADGFLIGSRAMATELAALGHSHEKHIPAEIKTLNVECLARLLDGIVDGDGTWTSDGKRRAGITTVSKRLLDDVMEIAMKLGYRSSFSSVPARWQMVLGTRRFCQKRYAIRLCRRNDDTWFSPWRSRRSKYSPFKRMPYSGPVHCVTVNPNNTVLTRYNGRLCWLGNSVAYTRLHPGAAVVILMTRWSRGDLVGRLLDPERAKDAEIQDDEKWEVINLPAIAESDDAMGRAPGEALFPERYPAERLRSIRASVGSYVWAALYRGDPVVRGGNYIPVSNFIVVDSAPEGLRWVRFWDLAASSKKSSDHTASIAGAIGPDGVLYLRDLVDGQWEWPEARNRIKMTAISEKIPIGVEAVAGFKTAFANLIEVMPSGIMCREYGADKDKLTRALPWIAMVEKSKVALVRGDWNMSYILQLEQWTPGKEGKDDMVDATSGVEMMLRTIFSTPVPVNVNDRFRQARESRRRREMAG